MFTQNNYNLIKFSGTLLGVKLIIMGYEGHVHHNSVAVVIFKQISVESFS